jgi:ABC-type dipeptide/oligopeptide/nickel transport system permease subunit
MVKTVGFHQVMWFVMIESAKDQILGVDNLGQHVAPRVWYGTTYLLIRNAIGCVSCSVEWGWHHTL